MGLLLEAVLYPIIDNGLLSKEITYVAIFDLFIFIENHWLFTAHYMTVACLFRLLFVRHTDNDLEIIKRRIQCLRAMTISVALGIIIFFLVFAAIEAKAHSDRVLLVIGSMEVVFCWAMTLMNLFSMRHILKSQKSLEQIDVFANRWIMISYVCTQCVWSLSVTIGYILFYYVTATERVSFAE